MTDVTETPLRRPAREEDRGRVRAKADSRPIPRSQPSRPARSEASRATLLSGPVLPTLMKLALPTVVVLLAQTAVNIAEAYYVGFLGTDALAGVALVFPVFMLMTMMSNGGIGRDVSAAVARAIGAARKEDANALVLHAIILGIAAGALFTLATIWGGPPLYRALGGRDETLRAALRVS
jgi:Na+-driven multidrug efflux pump